MSKIDTESEALELQKAGHCGTIFLISPIGSEYSDDREHADLVHKMLLEPAARELHSKRNCYRNGCAGLEVRRADHKASVGSVMTEVAQLIANADVIVAILSGPRADEINANVMYELGIAHAAARQTVVLHREGTTRGLPFDIQHMRATNYVLKPSRFGDQIKQIRQAIQQALDKEEQTRQWARDYGVPIYAFDVDGIDAMGAQYRNFPYYSSLAPLKPFDPDARPVGHQDGSVAGKNLGPSQIVPQQAFDKFLNIKIDEIAEMFLRSKKQILLIDPHPEMFVAELKKFVRNDRSRIDAIKSAVSNGVELDVLVTDPEHALLTVLMPGIGPERHDDHLAAFKLWQQAAVLLSKRAPAQADNGSGKPAGRPAAIVHRISDRVLPLRVLANEREAIVLPRFSGIPLSGQGPCVRISSMTKFHDEIFFEAKSAIRAADKPTPAGSTVVCNIGLDEVRRMLHAAEKYIFWHNPPFTAKRLPAERSSTVDEDQQLSWEFINLLIGRSITKDRAVRVVVSANAGQAIPIPLFEDAQVLKDRLSTSAVLWSRYATVASEHHGADITFAEIEAPVRLESIIATERSAVILPLDKELRFGSEIRAIRIEGGTVQHAALLSELDGLALGAIGSKDMRSRRDQA